MGIFQPEEEDRKHRAQPRVPVTALMAWPDFHLEMETEVENQVAAPAATRTPNLHRGKQSLTEECGWKGGDRVGLGAKQKQRKRGKTENREQPSPFPSWRNGDRAVLAVKGSLTPQRTRP